MTTQTPIIPPDWRDRLGKQDRQTLLCQGFLIISGAATPDRVGTMRTAWEQRMQQKAHAPDYSRRGNNDGPANLESDPAFRCCLEHPEVMSAVALLLDADVSLLGINGRNPGHGSGQQGFHVDSARPVAPDRQTMVNAFWLLDDMNESNGATRVIPGSHRRGRIPAKHLAQRDAQHPDAVAIQARAGDVLVFSAHLWHAGSKNHTGAARRIVMAHFGRDEVRLAGYGYR